MERDFSNPSEVAAWLLEVPFERLEQRIRNFSHVNQAVALDWARTYVGVDEAKIKLQVAVIGTLAPNELDEMN